MIVLDADDSGTTRRPALATYGLSEYESRMNVGSIVRLGSEKRDRPTGRDAESELTPVQIEAAGPRKGSDSADDDTP